MRIRKKGEIVTKKRKKKKKKKRNRVDSGDSKLNSSGAEVGNDRRDRGHEAGGAAVTVELAKSRVREGNR